MLIPDDIESFESYGEKLLFFKFKNDELAQDYYVLHSVFTNHHLNNVSGELDFLVLAPGKGFFAIEVKHGGVRREGGEWIFQNRKSEITRKTRGPFSQVEGTKHSIRNYVLNNANDRRLSGRLSKILFATGVVFTSMKHNQANFGPEGFSWQVLTEEGLRLPISKYIETLSKGWHNQYRNLNWYDVNESRPSVKDCEEMLKIIRGDFQIDYSEVNIISDNEKIIEEFTREQFHILDFTDFNDRSLIQGQAGTGKTVLALELARRRIKENKRVGLFCFNQKLGKKLKASLNAIDGSQETNSYANTLHKYLMRNVSNISGGHEYESVFFKEELPVEFLIQNEDMKASEKFDILIVDEAQDLLTDYYLEIFDWILKGGINNGKWVMFGDFSNQAIYLNDPGNAKKRLDKKSFFAKLPPLRINCRNTKKIANHNSLLTGAKLPEFTGKTLAGKPINAKFPAKSKQSNTVIKIVKSLLEKGIKKSQITLLSPKKIKNTYLADSDYINEVKNQGLQLATIHSFKGLENVVIILFDFDEILTNEAKRLLYVGISRATQELILVLNQGLEANYNRIVAENYLEKN
jgi:hypothetical protein